MTYRGRLIWPFVAEIAQYDAQATAVGPPVGFDDDFREPVRVADASPRGSHSARQEKTPHLMLPCQVETGEHDKLQQFPSGQANSTAVTLVFHFQDLEDQGLVDAVTGRAKLNTNDRLVAIYETGGALVQKYPDPPGLFLVSAQPDGFGLHGLRRNLLVVQFVDREQGTPRV